MSFVESVKARNIHPMQTINAMVTAAECTSLGVGNATVGIFGWLGQNAAIYPESRVGLAAAAGAFSVALQKLAFAKYIAAANPSPEDEATLTTLKGQLADNIYVWNSYVSPSAAYDPVAGVDFSDKLKARETRLAMVEKIDVAMDQVLTLREALPGAPRARR